MLLRHMNKSLFNYKKCFVVLKILYIFVTIEMSRKTKKVNINEDK